MRGSSWRASAQRWLAGLGDGTSAGRPDTNMASYRGLLEVRTNIEVASLADAALRRYFRRVRRTYRASR